MLALIFTLDFSLEIVQISDSSSLRLDFDSFLDLLFKAAVEFEDKEKDFRARIGVCCRLVISSEDLLFQLFPLSYDQGENYYAYF